MKGAKEFEVSKDDGARWQLLSQIPPTPVSRPLCKKTLQLVLLKDEVHFPTP